LGRDVLLATIIGAQGLKGGVKVKLFTATPKGLARYDVLHTSQGRKLKIAAYQPTREGEAVIAFEGIVDRSAAEALKGEKLFIDRAELPEPGEDEFYHADLIGLEARDSEGRVLGKVSGLHNYGASDVIELTRADGDSVLLAFSKQTVPTLNIEAGYIVVAVPEDDEDTDHVE
jgi:16S rRNA processing protein RimM